MEGYIQLRCFRTDYKPLYKDAIHQPVTNILYWKSTKVRLESVIDSGCAGVMHCKIRLVFFLSILEYSIVGNFIDYSEVKDRHLRSIGIIPKLAVGQKLLFATPEFMRSC